MKPVLNGQLAVFLVCKSGIEVGRRTGFTNDRRKISLRVLKKFYLGVVGRPC